MFARVTIRVSDAEASERFYETVLAALDVRRRPAGDWRDFTIAPAGNDASVTRRLHIGFGAATRAHVDAFWRAGIGAGHRDDGAPGPRPQYRHDYYGAFLLDPDGNSAEAVHHGALDAADVIDHLWLRVSDVRATTGFYESIAPHAGLTLASADEDHAWFQGSSGSFTLVAGEPTRHLHLAFGAGEDEPPASRDGGLPDPDGNTIEIVSALRNTEDA
jgi:catechol 2,3-dioxygenase-like lactoylglutathione lyase family enzyme